MLLELCNTEHEGLKGVCFSLNMKNFRHKNIIEDNIMNICLSTQLRNITMETSYITLTVVAPFPRVNNYP